MRFLILFFKHLTMFFCYFQSSYLWDLGLPSEEHEVITEDGYVLTMFRIPKPGATPALLMHGFMGTSDMWLLMERDSNLGEVN